MKFAFFNGLLEEVVYVTQPPDFEIKGKEEPLFKLNNTLCRLKQVPKAYNMMIYWFLVHQKFAKCALEYVIFLKNMKNSLMLLICLYLDDLLITGINIVEIVNFKGHMMSEFEIIE